MNRRLGRIYSIKELKAGYETSHLGRWGVLLFASTALIYPLLIVLVLNFIIGALPLFIFQEIVEPIQSWLFNKWDPKPKKRAINNDST